MSRFFWPHRLQPTGSSVHGISQARILVWVDIPAPGHLPDPEIDTVSAFPVVQVDSLRLSQQRSPYISIKLFLKLGKSNPLESDESSWPGFCLWSPEQGDNGAPRNGLRWGRVCCVLCLPEEILWLTSVVVVVHSLRCVWLFVTLVCSLPGSCVPGILQERILEWVAMPSSRGSSPGICSNSCPLSWWCYLTISSSAAPFSFCLQSFAASGSFPTSWLFGSSGYKYCSFTYLEPVRHWRGRGVHRPRVFLKIQTPCLGIALSFIHQHLANRFTVQFWSQLLPTRLS